MKILKNLKQLRHTIISCVESATRILVASTIGIVAIIIFSVIVFPFQNKQMCIQSDFLNQKQFKTSFARVISSFNRRGVPLTTGCGSNSIIVSSETLEGTILAHTIPYGALIPVSPKSNYKRDIFIPFIHLVQRRIVFNESYSEDYISQKTFFEATLVHEIGHVLGAPHVHNDPYDVMYPYISTSLTPPDFDLDLAVKQVLDNSNRITWTSYLK